MPSLRSLAVDRAGGGRTVASAQVLDGPNCKDLEIIPSHSHFGGEAEVQGGGLVGPGPPGLLIQAPFQLPWRDPVVSGSSSPSVTPPQPPVSYMVALSLLVGCMGDLRPLLDFSKSGTKV